MIDKLKRRTLKRIGLTAVATTAAVASGSILATNSVSGVKEGLQDAADLPLADIQVQTRVSAATNDIEVVIRNIGDHPTRISQLTPSQTMTKRGSFDFASLMADGDLHLAAGQSVSLPMTPHAVVIDASTTATERAQSLSSALKSSFSAITEHDAFARVTVVNGVRLV